MTSRARHAFGVLDTSVYIDLALMDPSMLPRTPEITAVTLAELHQGVAMAKTPVERALRTERLLAVSNDFDPLPFDGAAAARYGTLVALTIAANRSPRPRRMDLMIAAIASANDLPLFSRNPKDFTGLDSAVVVIAV